MKEFQGKVAVVTGAASGIGRALATRCAQEGMKVVLADIEEQALMQASQELHATGASILAVQTDVSKARDVEALAQKTFDTYGAVHLLFNNAGAAAGTSTSMQLYILLPKTTSSPCIPYYQPVTSSQFENGLQGDECNLLTLERTYQGLQCFPCCFNEGSLFPRSLQTMPPVLVTVVPFLSGDVDSERQVSQCRHQILLYPARIARWHLNALHFSLVTQEALAERSVLTNSV